MINDIKKLTFIILIGFIAISLTAAYWGLFLADGILAREDNPRQVQADRFLERGSIVDRNGVEMASGSQSDRRYVGSHILSAIGYYDFQYGASGLEAAYDDILTGELIPLSTWDTLQDELLHQPRVGFDLRSTIDNQLQEFITAQMAGLDGGAMLVHVPSGQVLSMVSHPQIDLSQFESYVDDNGDPINDSTPLFNRVRQASYQIGTLNYLMLLLSLLETDRATQDEALLALDPVDLSNYELPIDELGCEVDLASEQNLTIQNAFTFQCANYFVNALQNDPELLAAYQLILEQTGLFTPPPLHRLETMDENDIALIEVEDSDLLLTAIGQSDITINIVQMMRIIGAIANQGNAPSLHMADAYRIDSDAEWERLDVPRRQPALLRAEVALTAREAMLITPQNQLLQNALRADFEIRDYDLYGMTATAYAGSPLQWFVGFLDLKNGESLAFVIVIENVDSDFDLATAVGDILRQAVVAIEENE